MTAKPVKSHSSVICRIEDGERLPDEQETEGVVATHRFFVTFDQAKRYADRIAPGRKAEIVAVWPDRFFRKGRSE